MNQVICTTCGRIAGEIPGQKYCGNGSDKDFNHSYKQVPPEEFERIRGARLKRQADAQERENRKPGFWYLGSPYSLYPGGPEQAFRDACLEAAVLIKAGIPVFSPIAHTHPIAVNGLMDLLDLSIWLPTDKPMMDAAKGIIVCKMEWWEKSKGVAHEIEVFSRVGKPIIYMTPGIVPDEIWNYEVRK